MPVIYEPKGRAREYAPLACNIYKGCSHGCKYCYAPAATFKSREEFSKPEQRKSFLANLNKDARALKGTNKRVLFCFTTDPYHIGDTSITRSALQIMRRYGVPFQVLTKGGSRALRDIDLYGGSDCFASTLTFTPAASWLSDSWEPNAASPEDRYNTLEEFHKAGVFTWVSLEPVIDIQQSLDIIEQTSDFVDLYKVGIINHSPLTTTSDWQRFGTEAIDILESIGKPYFIKHDLRKHLPARLRHLGNASTDFAASVVPKVKAQVMLPGF